MKYKHLKYNIQIYLKLYLLQIYSLFYCTPHANNFFLKYILDKLSLNFFVWQSKKNHAYLSLCTIYILHMIVWLPWTLCLLKYVTDLYSPLYTMLESQPSMKCLHAITCQVTCKSYLDHVLVNPHFQGQVVTILFIHFPILNYESND